MPEWQPQQYDPRQHAQRLGQPAPWDTQNAPYGQSGQMPPPYQQQPVYQPPQQYYGPPRRRRSWPARHKVLTGILAFWGLVIVIVIAVAAASPSKPAGTAAGSAFTPAAQAPARAAAKQAPAKQTVTFIVTGSPADVTYGPAGSSVAGKVPMHASYPLGTPVYYSIEAQLQGGGDVTCKIEVDGKVISESVASGGYNIAMCEIGQDPLSGNWQDDNG